MHERESQAFCFRETPRDLEWTIRSDLQSTDAPTIHAALSWMKRTCPPQKTLELLTEFAQKNHSPAATQHSYDMITTAVQAMYRHSHKLEGEQMQGVRTFFDAVGSMVPAIISHGDIDYFASALLHAAEYHAEVGQFMEGALSEMLAMRWPPESAYELLSEVRLPAAATALTLALEKSKSRSTTFVLDLTLGNLAYQLERQRADLGEEDKEALFGLFEELMRIIPTCVERGHEQFLIAGVDDIVGSGHDLSDIARVLLQKVAPLRKIKQDAPQFPQLEPAIDFGELTSLAPILEKLPMRRQRQLARRFSQTATSDDRFFARLLSDIFDSDTSEHIAISHQQMVDDVACAANEPLLTDIISKMLDTPQQYQFQLAALLAIFPFDRLPKKLQKRIHPTVINLDMGVTIGFHRWWLCHSAEERLLESLYNEALVLVNGVMLVKMTGKLTGLCLQSCTIDEGGTFYEGNWYSPVDDDSRSSIRRAHDRGIAKIQLDRSTWALMRSISDTLGKSGSDIFQEVREVVRTLPNHFPSRIQGKSRREYRNASREEEDQFNTSSGGSP